MITYNNAARVAEYRIFTSDGEIRSAAGNIRKRSKKMKTRRSILCVILSLVLAFCAVGLTACDNNPDKDEILTTAQKAQNFTKSVTEIKEGEGFNFNIDNLSVAVPELETSYVGADSVIVDVKCDLAATANGELFAGKDATGAFTLKAHFSLTADMTKSAKETNEEVSGVVSHGTLEAALYVKGDKVYVKYAATTTYPGIPEAYREANEESHDDAMSMTLEQIKQTVIALIQGNLPEIPGVELPELDEGTETAVKEIAAKLEKLYNEKVAPVLAEKKAEYDEQTEKFISTLKKVALDITEENNGIVIKTNASKIKALNNELYTMTVSKLIDKYAGEGTFASLKTNIMGALDYTVGDVLDKLGENGITEDDLFTFLNDCATAIKGEQATIDELFGMEAGALRAKLDEEKDTKVLDVVKTYVPTLDETTIRQGLGVAFALMESSTAYDLIATVANSTASDGDAKFDKKAAKETVDAVLDILDKLFETTLTLDKKGNFQSLNVKITVDEDVVSMISDLVKSDDGESTDETENKLPNVTVAVGITVLKGEFINAAKYDYDAMADAIDNPAEEEPALAA